jgi:hypothetical protein
MEYQSDAEKSYIEIDGYFSMMGIKSVKEVVEKRFENLPKTDFYYDFINWDQKENEILMGTYRVPDSLPLFGFFDCVFNINNPEEFIIQECQLIHSLWNGWIPEGNLSKGNNHIVALKFENTIPEILHRLHVENQFRPMAPVGSFRLGLCCENDFAMIAKNIKAHLDNKHNS